MSERVSLGASQPDSVTLESGLEALQSGVEFRGPVEALDGHHCNDHFAQIYETNEERFAAAVPFVRHGLEGDERVMYVVDESSEEAVQSVLRDAGLDVDAALDSGALSFHTIQDTYLRNGSFDPDEMIEFYGETVAAATAEYEALRIVAETTWLQDDATTVEQFMEYESKVNELFADEDCLALCQYDRRGFPPEVVENIVQTHPHLIYDDAVCHNFYYTPPEEFFGADDPVRKVDRMLGTLRERTEAKTELQQREQFLQDLYEITSDPTRSFEEKLQALFDLGCERFGLELGAMAKVDPPTDRFEVECVSHDHEYFEPGLTLPLSETYCTAATENDGAGSVADPIEAGYDDIHVYREFGVSAYLGTYIEVEGDYNRTFFFVASEPRDSEFSDDELTFHRLLGQWVKYELERQHHERYLRESYEITSDPALSFEAKLERLLDLGREWFGLEMAGLNYLPSWDGEFQLEKGVGLGVDPDAELRTDPGDGCFCRRTITADAPVGMSDVRETDWQDDEIHEKFGLTSYLGTKVTSGSTPYGTLWFGSTKPRDRPFSDTERAFIDLMGQWVSYELEQREHRRSQRELYEITASNELPTGEKFERLLELGCEYFDLSVGMLTREREESFEIERMHGTHPDLGEGTHTPPMTDNYCRRVVETGEPISVADAGAAGWDGDALYSEFGLECYAGVQLTVGGDAYGTICFTDRSPRDAEFTEAERTFLDLMGQCVSYELERNHREAQLQQTNDRLESFASMLAHELRNPVTIGQIYSQQLPEETDAEATEYVTEAFDRIEDMIDVMLVLTRGQEAVGERTPVSLATVARDAWDNMDAVDATLDVTLDRTIRADETYVRHLFRNLLENAVEHGGEDVSVTVGNLPSGFYVADDGPGIPAEERDAVFEAGYTTTAATGGTGLGLAFVQKLAEVYEWDYVVTESAEGGARFEFRVD